MNDDIRRSWRAANRFDAPRHPFPWRADPAIVPRDGWDVLDAAGVEVAHHVKTKALAECIAALPEIMGEYKPVVDPRVVGQAWRAPGGGTIASRFAPAGEIASAERRKL